MERLRIDLKEKSYDIHINPGILHKLQAHIGKAEKWLIITDLNVDGLYGAVLEKELEKQDVHKYIIEPGEKSKNIATVEAILTYMINHGYSRKSKIIAFGGGVVGDLAGFCASVYMRGIRWIQVPTTLLAQVDSSVGGKTGINMGGGKNMVGSFYQPDRVVIDPYLLKTLPQKELLSGVGEVIKYGIIHDYDFLKYVDEKLDSLLELDMEVTGKVIKGCCEIKAEIVAKDEKERGLRKNLNFGHTIGHALEATTDYETYTHGEALLVGMYHETLLAKSLGWIDEEYLREILALINKTGINSTISNHLKPELVEKMGKDKKNTDGNISFILPAKKAGVKELLMPGEDVRRWWWRNDRGQ